MKRRDFLAGLGAGTLAAAGFDFLGKDARLFNRVPQQKIKNWMWAHPEPKISAEKGR